MFVILLICLIALVAGSAYGIFFAAESPDENAISVQEAVELLTEEYRDRLEEIENSTEYDRQEIESNDGSYAIAWQDVLAVFASQTSTVLPLPIWMGTTWIGCAPFFGI